jgi:hypothetical protein
VSQGGRKVTKLDTHELQAFWIWAVGDSERALRIDFVWVEDGSRV